MRVQKTARLHEKTVQKAAKGEIRPIRRRSKKAESNPTESKITKPNPIVLAVAKKVARKGTLMVVKDENTILIVNNMAYLKRAK